MADPPWNKSFKICTFYSIATHNLPIIFAPEKAIVQKDSRYSGLFCGHLKNSDVTQMAKLSPELNAPCQNG